MTLTEAAMKRVDERIAEIANGKFPDHEWYTPDDVKVMIRAALADPVLRREIENAAYERAAMVCEESPDRFEGNASALMAKHCAAAIRALKK